jgi:methionyl-tRNA formyltransferase
MTYVLATSRGWNEELSQQIETEIGNPVILINSKETLSYAALEKIGPRYIFFPHWSYFIPPEIYNNFECVIFHMADVPFGRGGSPLQNLIVRKIYETKITSLKCQEEMDAGPVYMKKSFSLFGSAEEIYLRASKVVKEMIIEIIKSEPTPQEQQGVATTFLRRKPEESNIENLAELEEVFDYIRMLDAEGYPKAFMETQNFRFEFSRPSLKHNRIIADVEITRKKKDKIIHE